jgi:hypothetical protein
MIRVRTIGAFLKETGSDYEKFVSEVAKELERTLRIRDLSAARLELFCLTCFFWSWVLLLFVFTQPRHLGRSLVIFSHLRSAIIGDLLV